MLFAFIRSFSVLKPWLNSTFPFRFLTHPWPAKMESGQGLPEYSIILALVALAAIGGLSIFGEFLWHVFLFLSVCLPGGDGYTINEATFYCGL